MVDALAQNGGKTLPFLIAKTTKVFKGSRSSAKPSPTASQGINFRPFPPNPATLVTPTFLAIQCLIYPSRINWQEMRNDQAQNRDT